MICKKKIAKKSIVFLNQSSGYLMIDIVNVFKEKYAQRILITGFLNPRNRLLENDVKIEWIVEYNRKSSLKRLYTWSLAFFKAFVLIKYKYKNSDLFLVSNPPLSVFLPLFCKNPFKVLIYDIYPDAFVELNQFKKNFLLVKLWEAVNKKVYKKAQKIFTLTEGMKKRLSKFVDLEKIEVVPLWTDNDFLKAIPKADNPFIKEHDLEGKFVVMYSGNLGKSHPVEILLDFAKQITDNRVIFLIVGDGDKYERIKNKIKESGLENLILLPWQPTKMLPYTLSAADLAVVMLDNCSIDLSIPSRTYNFL